MEKRKDTKKTKEEIDKKKKTEVDFNPTIEEVIAHFEEEYGELSAEEIGIIEEELSHAARLKKKVKMKRFKTKIKRARDRSSRRRANTKVLEKRARRTAISAMKKKFAKGKDLKKASASEKNRIERMVKTRKKIIDRATKVGIRDKRSQERQRLSASERFEGTPIIETLNTIYDTLEEVK